MVYFSEEGIVKCAKDKKTHIPTAIINIFINELRNGLQQKLNLFSAVSRNPDPPQQYIEKNGKKSAKKWKETY